MNEHTPINSKDKSPNTIDKIDGYLDSHFPGYDDKFAKIAKDFGKKALIFAAGASLVGGGAVAYNELGPRTPLRSSVTEYVIPQGDPAFQVNSLRSTLVDTTVKLTEETNVNIQDVKGATSEAKEIYNDGDLPSYGGVVVTLRSKPFFGHDITAQRFDKNIPSGQAPLEQSEK